jgi:hypothetical protein
MVKPIFITLLEDALMAVSSLISSVYHTISIIPIFFFTLIFDKNSFFITNQLCLSAIVVAADDDVFFGVGFVKLRFLGFLM